MTERIPLQEVLDSIKAVCDANCVMYNLERITGQDDGARIRIAYVRPDQKLTYIMSVTAGTHEGREDILEEECLFEVDWDGDKWAHKFTSTMKSMSKVLVGLKGKLEGACTGTNWDSAHQSFLIYATWSHIRPSNLGRNFDRSEQRAVIEEVVCQPDSMFIIQPHT